MNKKGQMLMLKIMLGIIVLIMAMAFTYPLKENIEYATNETTGLNCSSGSLTENIQATCIFLDMSLFYFLGAMISVGMAFIAGKRNAAGAIQAIVIFIVVSVLINPLKDLIIYARDASHLNCTAATLSVGNRLSCILFDAWLFWFVAIALAAAVTYIFVKTTGGSDEPQ